MGCVCSSLIAPAPSLTGILLSNPCSTPGPAIDPSLPRCQYFFPNFLVIASPSLKTLGSWVTRSCYQPRLLLCQIYNSKSVWPNSLLPIYMPPLFFKFFRTAGPSTPTLLQGPASSFPPYSNFNSKVLMPNLSSPVFTVFFPLCAFPVPAPLNYG